MGEVVARAVDPVAGDELEPLQVLDLGLGLHALGGDEGASSGGFDERRAGADVADELVDEELATIVLTVATLLNSATKVIHPERIELPSQEPESCVISITLRVATNSL